MQSMSLKAVAVGLALADPGDWGHMGGWGWEWLSSGGCSWL